MKFEDNMTALTAACGMLTGHLISQFFPAPWWVLAILMFGLIVYYAVKVWNTFE